MVFPMLAASFVLFMFLDQIALMLVLVPIYMPILKGYRHRRNLVLDAVPGGRNGRRHFSPFGYTLFAMKSAAPEVPMSHNLQRRVAVRLDHCARHARDGAVSAADHVPAQPCQPVRAIPPKRPSSTSTSQDRARGVGQHERRAVGGNKTDRAATPNTRASIASVIVSVGAPSPSMRPRSSTTMRSASSAARLRSCRIATTRDAARGAGLGRGDQHVELVAQVETGGRLVEQQHAGAMLRLATGELDQHAGQMRALLLAARQRGDDASWKPERST